MTPLPLVLVGCGAVSRLFYAPALHALESAGVLSVVALVDPLPEARRRLQSEFPAAIPSVTLADVETPSGALAVIASPPRWHADHTVGALARGWHVLCEKPMAASSEDAGRMLVAAAAADRVLAIGHYKRFFPSSRCLKALCRPDGALGPLRRFTIAEGGPFDWPAAGPAFFQRRETPGGVLLDVGIHVLDLLLWWLGEPETFDYADDAMGGLEANARLNLRFGLVHGRVQLSRDWATTQRYEFEFLRGTVGWTVNDANGLTVTLRGTAGPLTGRLLDHDAQPAETNAQSFIAQLQHVAAAIRHGTPLLVDGAAGARALQLVEACYARRQPLAQPWLAPEEQVHARLQGLTSVMP